jgi:hypothetical protein
LRLRIAETYGQPEAAGEFLAEFVRLKVDVIHTITNADALEAKRVTSVIPIVAAFCRGGAPHRTRGYVRSSSPSALAGPTRGGRHTGISLTIAEPANQAVRPAYAKLDEGCSEWAEPSLNA